MMTNELIRCIEKAITKMKEALDDPREFGIVLQNINYEFNNGMYYAYMDVLMEQDFNKWAEIHDKYHNDVERLANIADVRYQSLKKICNIA